MSLVDDICGQNAQLTKKSCFLKLIISGSSKWLTASISTSPSSSCSTSCGYRLNLDEVSSTLLKFSYKSIFISVH